MQLLHFISRYYLNVINCPRSASLKPQNYKEERTLSLKFTNLKNTVYREHKKQDVFNIERKMKRIFLCKKQNWKAKTVNSWNRYNTWEISLLIVQIKPYQIAADNSSTNSVSHKQRRMICCAVTTIHYFTSNQISRNRWWLWPIRQN